MSFDKVKNICSNCGITVVALDRDGLLSSSKNKVFRCPDCGLVGIKEELSADTIKGIYSVYSYGNQESWDISKPTARYIDNLIKSLGSYKELGSFLDIGCGAGFMLHFAKLYGFNVEGVELSDVALKKLQEQGYRMHFGPLRSLNLASNSYDVITMSEILEHLDDPLNYMLESYRLLRKGGVLYIATPNFDSYRRRLFGIKNEILPPEHIWSFNRKSLNKHLGKAGFGDIHIWTDGLNPYELLEMFASSFNKDYKIDSSKKTESLRLNSSEKKTWRALKTGVNALMRISNLGISLKAFAVK